MVAALPAVAFTTADTPSHAAARLARSAGSHTTCATPGRLDAVRAVSPSALAMARPMKPLLPRISTLRVIGRSKQAVLFW